MPTYSRNMMLRFHDGTNLAATIEQLSECVRKGQDLGASAAGQGDWSHLNDYVRWVATTESQLRNAFTDVAIVHHLRSRAYWAIRDSDRQAFRVIELVNTEVAEQLTWLEGLTDRLRRLQVRLDEAPGRAVVLDTNVLLHYEVPWEVKWDTVVRQEDVRLVVPLRVVEELDEKKYTSRNDLADRARRLLSQLWEMLKDSAGGPVWAREHVTIEVLIEEGTRIRTVDADEEILDSCQQLRNVGRPPILVTGDTGMSLRAKALRLDVARMPDKYRRIRVLAQPPGASP